jgi:Ankyrin repeats (3 copies)/Ankyrin repeats (many copies)
MELVRAIVSGDARKASRLIAESPHLVHERAVVGASRGTSEPYFFEEIKHYLYAGDTALHMAAAGFKSEIVQVLIDRGADCSVKNRRGAEPLHYASDANTWNPTAQAATIACLIRAAANPNAVDKSGVPPLHRAVRTRSAAAVQALLAGDAEPRGRNKSGSTPLHLAVQNTGRGGSGTPHAIEQQRQIILLLLQNGGKPDDKDVHGKSVRDAVTADWIRELLQDRP